MYPNNRYDDENEIPFLKQFASKAMELLKMSEAEIHFRLCSEFEKYQRAIFDKREIDSQVALSHISEISEKLQEIHSFINRYSKDIK